MLPAIGFDGKPMFDTEKVENEGSERVLTSEFGAHKTSITKQAPESVFSVGRTGPEFFRAGNQRVWWFSEVV